MHPHSRLAWSLMASLALWAPTFQATLDGDVDVLAATFRWVVAFAVASVGVSLLTGLVHAYRPTPSTVPTDEA